LSLFPSPPPSFNICFLLPSFCHDCIIPKWLLLEIRASCSDLCDGKMLKITMSIVRHKTIIFHPILWALLVTLRSINYILLCVYSL
jgi:hypothetical protein